VKQTLRGWASASLSRLFTGQYICSCFGNQAYLSAPAEAPTGLGVPSEKILCLKTGYCAFECLYRRCQVRLTMIVEAEWNRRLGRGFDSRRLHHKHTGRLGTARRVLGEWPFVEVMPLPRCVCDGGDMGSTGRNKG
jgi:hypothetical protein